MIDEFVWGPARLGIDVIINPNIATKNPRLMAVDVEDNEAGKMVGIGIYRGGKAVYYFTEINETLLGLLDGAQIIGQNFKSDFHKLKAWGIPIRPEQMVFDTKLASYTVDSSKQSHGLKDMAKEYFGLSWPTYTELTTAMIPKKNGDGLKKSKTTLDYLPVETVAAYNAMDCIATWRLFNRFNASLSVAEKFYLEGVEMPTMRVLADMESKGLRLDVDYMNRLYNILDRAVDRRKKVLWEMAGTEFNPNSSQQKVEVLNKMGIPVDGADKKKDLAKYEHEPFVHRLMKYSEVRTIHSTFSKKLVDLAVLSPENRIYGEFNQTTVTGRLSSANPNLQNIPSKGRLGYLVRRAFVAKPGHTLICADYSQLEPRVLAHFSEDPYLMNTFLNDADVYKALIAGTGRDRNAGKVFYLAMSYGAKAKKLAQVFKCSEEEAQRFLDKCWINIPKVKAHQYELIQKAREDGYVRTLYGRRLKTHDLNSVNKYRRWAAERRLVNGEIQGSAAEIVKMAMVRLAKQGIVALANVHDELLFEVPNDGAIGAANFIKKEMEHVVKLKVPLKVSIGGSQTWGDAKV